MALEDLELGACEEAVYRLLIERTSASLAEVAAAAAAPDAEVAEALHSLAARALVDGQPGSGHYVAAPPSVALGTEPTERRIRLHRSELALAELVETYRTGSMGRAQRDRVEVVEGRDAVRRRYLQLQLSSRQAIDTFVTGDVQVVGPENTEEPTVLSRGLQVRAVIDQSFLGEPRAADNVDESLAQGMRIRTVDGVPLKLIVCDCEDGRVPHGAVA
ncbi:hypothetical protein ACWEQP_34550 [Streptomyces sp. NPDC004044]